MIASGSRTFFSLKSQKRRKIVSVADHERITTVPIEFDSKILSKRRQDNPTYVTQRTN